MSTPFGPNSSFIPGTNLQFAVDSTSVGMMKTCWRKYYYGIVLGYRSRQTGVDLTFGLHYHAILEKYDHLKAGGADHTEATRGALRVALELTWDFEKGRPWDSGDNNKNRFTLVRSILWYLDQFEIDPVTTLILDNGKPAVELSFRLELDYRADLSSNFILCGHLDRVGTFSDDVWVLDRKSTRHTLDDNYFAQFTPHNQFSTYVFGGGVVYNMPFKGIICDAAQIGVEFTRFQRAPIMRTASQIEEWYKDLGLILEGAKRCADDNYWPMNEQSCFRCEFRQICSLPPSTREQWLKSSYTQRVWDPLVTRDI